MNIQPARQMNHLKMVARSTTANAFFTDKGEGKGLDLQAIADTSVFSMKLKGARADDALMACGAALAAGKPSLYVVESRKELPWFLREADLSYPSQVSIVEGSAQPTPLSPGPSPDHSGLNHDTFIGCLMSGLSKEQYAEGRSHLQQIDQALRTRVGSPNNYCEGISVSTTDTFDTPKASLVQDIKAVQGSRNCVFYAFDGQSRPSGLWVEAGYAIESGKPCTFLVPEKGCLPPSLRQGPLPENVKIVEYGDHANFLNQINNAPEAWLSQP